MGQIEEILKCFLTGYSESYRRFRFLGNLPSPSLKSFNELNDKLTKIQRASLWAQLSRMERLDLVAKRKSGWQITSDGVKRYFRRQPLSTGRPKKNLIVIFDIPEKKRNLRDWLRYELRSLDFYPLQHSVWFGPGPLPRELIKKIAEKRIAKCLKYFQVQEKDIA